MLTGLPNQDDLPKPEENNNVGGQTEQVPVAAT
jgi:hypothetical protein